MDKLTRCDCGNDFFLKEQRKTSKHIYACRIVCRECGRFSWGIGLNQNDANETAKDRWNNNETTKIG